MSLLELKNRYALTDKQAELLLMFKDASADTPIALYDLPGAGTHWRARWATALVDKGLLHRAKGECSEGYVCGVYWLDDLVLAHLEKEG